MSSVPGPDSIAARVGTALGATQLNATATVPGTFGDPLRVIQNLPGVARVNVFGLVSGKIAFTFQQQTTNVDLNADGSIDEESQVPSTNELAAFHRINPATAAKGVAQLATDGVIYKKRGIGMFVATGARSRLLERRREDFARQFVAPLMAEAHKLGIEPETALRKANDKFTGRFGAMERTVAEQFITEPDDEDRIVDRR